MLDSYQRVKMSVTVTKKTYFQDSQDPDEFDIIAADWLSLQYKKNVAPTPLDKYEII